jgi:hypothetical protein
MTASQKAKVAQRNLLALLTAQADLANLQETIQVLTRSIADAHGIPASYPPVG